MIPVPTNDRDALIGALFLAIIAPTDAKSRKAERLAQSFASRLSRKEVKECQRIAYHKARCILSGKPYA